MHLTNLIKDPYFRVRIDYNASSLSPLKGIWYGQHTCVSEGFALDDPLPLDPTQAIINHQLKVKHWSVLEFAFVVLHFGGFPHDTVMQLVRHQDSSPLVCSNRYTGQRFIDCAKHLIPVDRVFYNLPVGHYSSRNGIYTYTENMRKDYYQRCWESCVRYWDEIRLGLPEEVARRSLLGGFRQNFTMAGTFRAVMHWLDQRTLADSQIEAQTLAWMALDVLEAWEPQLFQWYRENRAGRNMLAP